MHEKCFLWGYWDKVWAAGEEDCEVKNDKVKGFILELLYSFCIEKVYIEEFRDHVGLCFNDIDYAKFFLTVDNFSISSTILKASSILSAAISSSAYFSMHFSTL